jgi:hypothetical protein
VVFRDIQHFQLKDVADGGSFTHLITSGTSNLCSLLVVPQFTASSNSTAALTPTLSPFDCGVFPSPLAVIGNYNVRVAGENLYAWYDLSEGRHYQLSKEEFRRNTSFLRGVLVVWELTDVKYYAGVSKTSYYRCGVYATWHIRS